LIRPAAVAAAGLAATLLAGCLGAPNFICHADSQCGTNAFCEADGHCSAHDPSCPSRRRYLAAAGDRGNACVGTTCAADPVVALAAGSAHACVLRQAGGVTCWGRNADGQLGDGTVTPRSSGVPVAGLTDAIAIAAGDRHTCAVRRGGQVVCWGADDTGQLGDGSAGVDRLAPAPVTGVVNATAIAAGAGFSCALLEDQSVVCWGDDRDGEVGDATTSPAPRPPTPVTGLTGARALTASGQHACAILADTSLVCWGSNTSGQLGDGTLVNRPQPTPVPGLTGVTAVAGGLSHTCALSSAGLSCWGSNSQGQLGIDTGTSPTPITTPMPVVLAAGATAIGAGAQHTCAVRGAGQVLCWGQNGSGQLGEGSMSSLGEPVPVMGLDTGLTLAGGTTFTCATTTDGAVFCWGDDHDGELATGRDVVQPRPVALDVTTSAMAVGGAHSCAVTHEAGSSVFSCWGSDQAGQLGDNGGDDRSRPGPIEQPLEPGQIAAGGLHTCAVDASGRLWCWGRGSSGQIGPARMVDTPVPIAVSLPAGTAAAQAVSAGDAHTCAVLTDAAGGGVAACFGANDRGQLGDGTTTPHAAPAPVTLGSPPRAALAVSAGGAHTCALDADGQIWCWGANDQGQLGTPPSADQSAPVAVVLPNGAAARAVSAGEAHTCAVDTTNRLVCWGANDHGQLGIGVLGSGVGTPTVVSLPVAPATVSAGGAHTCASLQDGRIFCWGANESGQLGDGTTTDRGTPAAVTGASGQAVAGRAHTCAWTPDGHAACWGANSSGQIGDDARLTISAPQLAQVPCM
jgi:alpha-tubulin suppressor-like RCC1 family protein